MKKALYLSALMAMLLPTNAFSQFYSSLPVIAAEEEQSWEDIEEQINEKLIQINRETENQINSINDYFSKIDFSRKNDSQTNAAGNTTQQAPRGIQFSTSEPTRKSARSSTRLQRETRERRRDAEHQAWLDEKRERQREANRRRQEYERQKAEAEARMREEIRARVTAEEYIREGKNTQNKIAAARYRTGEGAIMMDRMHSSQNLMKAKSDKNFSNPSVAGRHKLHSLGKNSFSLEPGAIPWATMKKDALPWSEWEKKISFSKIAAPLAELPKVKFTTPEAWRQLSQEIPEERFKMIKAVIYGINNGEFPNIHKVKDKDLYVLDLKDDNKVMVLSADGASLDVVSFTDKDMSWKNIKDNLRKSTLSMNTGIMEHSLSAEVKPFASDITSSDEVKLSSKLSGDTLNAKAALNIGGKGKELITLSDKKSIKNELFTASIPCEESDNKGQHELNDKSKDKIKANAEIKFSINALDWTSSVKKQTYNFSSVPLAGEIVTGNGWRVKGGIEAKIDNSLSMDVTETSFELKAKIETKLTFAEAEVNSTIIHKVPFYDGYCFSEVSGDINLGYNYSFSKSVKEGTNKSFSTRKQMGSLPISFGTKAKLFRFVSVKEIDEAFNKAISE